MKILLNLVSWFFVILSIVLVITAFVHFWPYIDFVIIGNKEYKTATGIVGASYSTLSKSTREGPSTEFATAESKTVQINFTDEDDNFFKVTFYPVFLNVKNGKKIKVKYYANDFSRNQAKERRENGDFSPEYVSGCPVPLIYSLEKPLIFLLAALVAFILRYVPLFIMNDPHLTNKMVNNILFICSG